MSEESEHVTDRAWRIVHDAQLEFDRNGDGSLRLIDPMTHETAEFICNEVITWITLETEVGTVVATVAVRRSPYGRILEDEKTLEQRARAIAFGDVLDRINERG